jgi:hypothetical protein
MAFRHDSSDKLEEKALPNFVSADLPLATLRPIGATRTLRANVIKRDVDRPAPNFFPCRLWDDPSQYPDVNHVAAL